MEPHVEWIRKALIAAYPEDDDRTKHANRLALAALTALTAQMEELERNKAIAYQEADRLLSDLQEEVNLRVAAEARVEELEREVEGWARESEKLERLEEGYYVDAQQQRERAEAAEAVVERYERALRAIARMKDYGAAMVAVGALSKTPESTDLTHNAKSV